MSPCQVAVPVDPWSQQAQIEGGVDFGQAGFYVPALAPLMIYGAAAISARAWFWRFVCPRTATISKVGFGVVTGATVDDPVDVGIYDSTLATLLSSSGSRSGLLNSAGQKVVPLAAPVQLVEEQVYYAALSCGAIGGTAAVTANCVPGGYLPQHFGQNAPQGELLHKIPFFPLAANPQPSPVATANNAPVLALIP